MTALALIAPIEFIVEALKPVLVFLHDSITKDFGGWGMAIVLLTVIVRALMAPLTVKQFKSMRAMVAVAPQLKEIQKKYKDDKQRQQQEVMKFYSENKINPFASCLPLVAQLPFFIGLFYLLQTDLRFEICGQSAKVCGEVAASGGAEKFLFIPDLTSKATGWVLAVLILLYIGSQLLSTLLTPTSPDRTQRMIMYGLPFVFTFFIISFPAGLIVYWITTNLWTVGQGYVIRRKLGPMPSMKPSKDEDGEPADAGPAGFFSKLTGATSVPAEPAPATAKGTSSGGAAPRPPRPPRKKKKRSGRRR